MVVGRAKRGPRPDVRPHLLLHAGGAADPRAGRGAASSATSSTSTRCGSTSAWCSPTSTCFWDLAPHDLSILDFILPGRTATRVGVAATAPTRSGPGKACVGYLTMPLASGAHGARARQLAQPHQDPHDGHRRLPSGPSSGTTSTRQQRLSDLRPRRRPGASQAVGPTTARAAARSPTGSATWSAPALPERRRCGVMVDRVRRRDPRGPARAHRRRGRAARARASSRPPAAAWRPAARSSTWPTRRSADGARSMNALRGARGSWSPAAPARSARRSSTSSSTPAPARRRRARQLRPRPAGQPRRRAGDPAGSTLVEGDIRDRDLVHDLTDGIDLVFHQAAIRITQCAEEPRLALEVLVDGTFNVLEAAAAAGVGKVVAASSASVYGLAEQFPTTERHHPHNNDTFYGAAKVVQRGHAAQLPRDVRARLRRAALLQRLRPADGHPRRLHRGAGPLDGAHRGRRAAADLRRRLARPWTSSTRDDIARANILAATQRRRRGVYNIASGDGDQPARAGRGAAAGDGLRPGAEHGPERAVNGVARRLADISRGGRDLRLRPPTIDLEDGLRGLVDWWRAEREATAAGRDPARVVSTVS